MKVLLLEYCDRLQDAVQILRENQYTDFDRKIISELNQKSSGRKLIVSGVCQRADVKNGNGRIYPRNILEREIQKYKRAVAERRAVGTLDHEDDSVINLEKVSHMLTDIWWDKDEVKCKAVIFDNPKIPCGQIAAGLIEEGVMFGISSRALGSIKEEKDYTLVEDDLSLICFDLVSDPSTQGAWLKPDIRGDFSNKLNQDTANQLSGYLSQESLNLKSTIDQILKG